ncbi:MAG TPA: LysR family transcriptional regulator [Archangium sp.]|nr:LysR family transcriptional regulator [Archangium sp.]
MATANISGMDLNLLLALDALLTERHVSRAAAKLGTSQPSLSRALAQLRLWIGDPLLVRTRHGMTPTPRALALAGEVRAVLERIDGLVGGRGVFEPATSRRVFRLSAAEYPQGLLFPELLARLLQVAPGVGLSVQPWSLRFPEALEEGTLELALAPTGELPPGLRSEPVVGDRFCCVMRKGHPAAGKRLTLERFVQLRHLQVAPTGREGSVLDDLLSRRGLSRQVVVRVPSFVLAPVLLGDSDLCATLPELLAARFAHERGLVVRPLPAGLSMPGLVLKQVWHERAQQDAGLEWLRGEIRAVGARLGGFEVKKAAPLDLRRRERFTL